MVFCFFGLWYSWSYHSCMVNPPFLTIRSSSALTFYFGVIGVNVILILMYPVKVKGV